MKSKSATAVAGTRSRHKAATPQGPALTALALAAFVLLAIALCVRSLLGEIWGAFLTDLLDISGTKVAGSLMVRYTVYLVTAVGLSLAVLWVAVSGRRWRVTGLEAGALLLIVAACLSVPFASDKRMAINTAIDTILPLLAAGCLYQLLADSSRWRRALLGVVVAVAAVNSYKASAQRYWEYNQLLRDYQQNKAMTPPRAGQDPQAALAEAQMRARQPVGYFHHANVLASFLALGVAGIAAALASAGWWKARRTAAGKAPDATLPDQPEPNPTHRATSEPANGQSPPRVPFNRAVAATCVLVLLAAWLLVGISWIGSAGAAAGLLAGLIVVPVAWQLRDRPRRLAAVLAGAFLLLQTTLLVLAVKAPDLYPKLVAHGGKVKSLAVRLNYWEGALTLFARNPLTGVGPGQFSQNYLTIKPVYAAEGVMNPHNWLLAIAAEWGIVGLLGLLTALGAAGWTIVRSLREPVQPDSRPITAAILPAALALLGCWWITISDMAPAARNAALLLPVIVSLVAMAAVSLSGLFGRVGQVILLAAAAMFCVHGSVETAPGTPGAAWAFWAIVALAMAWKGPQPDASSVLTPTQRRASRAAILLPFVAALAVVVLIVQPMRAFGLMERARQALAVQQRDRAVQLLRVAGEADPLDALPLNIAAYLQRQLIPYDPSREIYYLQQAVRFYDATVQRDPVCYVRWRNLAMSRMYLACAIEDPKGIDEAIDAMRKALAIFPTSPDGWMELAQMAAVTNNKVPDKPELLNTGIDAADKALALNAQWDPEDKTTKFTPAKRAELQRLRQQLQIRLDAALARAAATRDTSP